MCNGKWKTSHARATRTGCGRNALSRPKSRRTMYARTWYCENVPVQYSSSIKYARGSAGALIELIVHSQWEHATINICPKYIYKPPKFSLLTFTTVGISHCQGESFWIEKFLFCIRRSICTHPYLVRSIRGPEENPQENICHRHIPETAPTTQRYQIFLHVLVTVRVAGTSHELYISPSFYAHEPQVPLLSLRRIILPSFNSLHL